jgi:hypothetical protein
LCIIEKRNFRLTSSVTDFHFRKSNLAAQASRTQTGKKTEAINVDGV